MATASLEVEGLLDVATPILKLRPVAPATPPAAVEPGAPSAGVAGTGVRLQPSRVHLTHQLREIEWVAIPGEDGFSMGSDPSRDESAAGGGTTAAFGRTAYLRHCRIPDHEQPV